MLESQVLPEHSVTVIDGDQDRADNYSEGKTSAHHWPLGD